MANQLLEALDAEAPVESHIIDAAFDAQQVVDLSRESLDFLAALSLPTVYQYAFPPVFLTIWGWLREYIAKTRDFSQLALGLPRGFGKTLLIKLFALYCTLFTNRRFILILCENQTKANNILADIADMLNEENVRRTFGDWRLGLETDRQELKKFGFRGRTIILMAGTVEVIRGISLKNERPDVMIFDDIQSRTCAESQTQSESLEREMTGTAMKAKSPRGCLFLFIANMYPTKWSILRKLKSNPNWIKFIAGGILADGTSLWEDLQPLEQLLREYENDLSMGRPEIFYSEVLNDETASSNFLINLQKLPTLPFQEGDIHGGNFVIIDPSTGKLGSDNVAIGYFEVYDGYPVLRKLINERLSPMNCIVRALELCLTYQCRLVAIESVAYQSTLGYWFRFVCEQRQIYGIEAVEIYPGQSSKNSRILTMFKALSSGEVFVDTPCRGEVHLQILQFNPMKKDNTDDILDLLTYPHKVMEEFGEYIVATQVIYEQEHASIEVLPPEANCCF